MPLFTPLTCLIGGNSWHCAFPKNMVISPLARFGRRNAPYCLVAQRETQQCTPKYYMPGILELQNADKGATSILEASKENKHYDAHQGIILCKPEMSRHRLGKPARSALPSIFDSFPWSLCCSRISILYKKKIMLRTSQELNSNSDIQGYSARAVRQSIETDPIVCQPDRQREAAWRSSSKPNGLPEREQSRIYHDWISMITALHRPTHTDYV